MNHLRHGAEYRPVALGTRPIVALDELFDVRFEAREGVVSQHVEDFRAGFVPRCIAELFVSVGFVEDSKRAAGEVYLHVPFLLMKVSKTF